MVSIRDKYLITAAVAVFVIATGVLVQLGRSGGESAGSRVPAPPVGQGDIAHDDGPGDTDTGAATPVRAASQLPLTRLAKGEEPPQLVLFSFDGAGAPDRLAALTQDAAATDARYTVFLRDWALLDGDHRDAYRGPGPVPTAMGGSAEEVLSRAGELAAAHLAGHEIATGYDGSYCPSVPPADDDWSAADWSAAVAQFADIIDHWSARNGYTDVPALPLTSADIQGGRTCPDVDAELIASVMATAGMTFDASPNLYTGIGWPQQFGDTWIFQTPYAYAPPADRALTLRDYILRDWLGEDDAVLRTDVVATYQYLFDEVHQGSRAPLVVQGNLDRSADDGFARAVAQLMDDWCGWDDVYCVTFSEAVAWLEAQDPEVLAQLQARPVVATGG